MTDPKDTAPKPPVRLVRDQLRKTEEVIRALRTDLDDFRRRADSLSSERDELVALLSRSREGISQQTQLVGERNLLASERERLAGLLDRLERENQELRERCEMLELELANTRMQAEESREIIVYLETQVEQLEAMVRELREHNLFVQSLKH